MKFKLIVNQTDHYQKTFEVEAESEEEAKAKLEEDLDACPLDTQSNTLQSSEVEIQMDSK